MLDSGASTSVMSVGKYLNKQSKSNVGGSLLIGIGGNQTSGPPIKCKIKFNCIEDVTYEHELKPVVIEGEKRLVILGRDFLSLFEQTDFDWRNCRVRLGNEWVYWVEQKGTSPVKDNGYRINRKSAISQQEELQEMINSYADVFAHNPRAPRESLASPHSIVSKDDRVCKDKVRRTPSKWQDSIQGQVKEMLENGIIRKSSSPYNSNPLLVDKNDGSKRFVVDFRTLNKNTTQDSYPLPNIDDMLDGFKGCKYFSQVDLASGYWGIPISEKDRQKTAFCVPGGKYEFCRMPFGLVNSQATFQRNMDDVVRLLHQNGFKGVGAYVDNIVVFTQSYEEHLETVEALLKSIQDYNFSLRASKCEFGFEEIQFLGFCVNGETVKASPDNISKIERFPTPRNRKEIQRFLGLCNFNRRFVNNYTDISAPLNRLTSQKVKFKWEKDEEEAFAKMKNTLCETTALYLPDWSKPFHVKTDASDIAVGAMLFQYDVEGVARPIAYHSKSLSAPEKKWTVTEKEFYAIVNASRKWTVYCYTQVTFHTDHQPLKYIRSQKDPRGKIGRWLMELENIDYRVEYCQGKDNKEADYLSRIKLEGMSNEGKHGDEQFDMIYTYNSISVHDEQHKDADIAQAILQLKDNGKIKTGPYRYYNNLTLQNGSLLKGGRLVIPPAITGIIIQEYHGQHHVGAENTLLLIKRRYYWKNMDRQVSQFVGNCRTCIQFKTRKAPKSPLQTDDLPKPRERIAIDIGAMPLSSKGNTCFFINNRL